ncbi:hypothetical protein BGW80DRAFT_1436174 [Lactifluus volemus]|nr:hypothetical protein BGW80DRAFT_1436174 [Lactifluus volemus]
MPLQTHEGPTGILASHRIFVLQAKLSDANMSEIYELAEKADADVVGSPEEAEIVVTAIGMRKRLERHLDWDLAKTKALVTPDWLRDSIAQGRLLPCADYAALSELKATTEMHCPRSASLFPQNSPSKSKSQPPTRTSRVTHVDLTPPAFLLPPPVPPPPEKLDHTARFSCSRPSPLVCVNQSLCSALDILRRSRALESNERSALSYARSIAVSLTLPPFPRKITARERSEVQRLPFIGKKVSKMIDEYLFHGHIAEVEETRKSDRFVTLSLFATIHGIGPVTARKLYGLGLRTLRDLEAYYEVDTGSTQAENRDGTEMDTASRLACTAEAIHATIMDHLNVVEPGWLVPLSAGMSHQVPSGKSASNDIDVVFTHPNATSAKGLCARLVERLRSAGLVTHVMHLSGFHEYDALRTAQWDSLEKALTVYKTPNGGRHRRTYWTAIVGWTGATMFQRDLRGLKFDSSAITRRRDSHLIFPRSEKEVFDVIGLPWVDPTLRNTDA